MKRYTRFAAHAAAAILLLAAQASYGQEGSHHRPIDPPATLITFPMTVDVSWQDNGLEQEQKEAIVDYHINVVNRQASSVLLPTESLVQAAAKTGTGDAYVVLLTHDRKTGVAVLSVNVTLSSKHVAVAHYPMYPVFQTSCMPNCESPIAPHPDYGGRPGPPNNRTDAITDEELREALGRFEGERNGEARGFYVPSLLIKQLSDNRTPYVRAYFFKNGAGETKVALLPADNSYKVTRGRLWIVGGGGVCPPSCE